MLRKFQFYKKDSSARFLPQGREVKMKDLLRKWLFCRISSQKEVDTTPQLLNVYCAKYVERSHSLNMLLVYLSVKFLLQQCKWMFILQTLTFSVIIFISPINNQSVV